MANKRTPGSRPGLIHCDNCGEDYSSSYRRCPFCDEYSAYEEESEYEYEDEGSRRASTRSGGKRLAPSNRRGGGYRKTSLVKSIFYLLSLAIILAAIWIVVTKVMPLIQRGDIDPPDPDTVQSDSAFSDPDDSGLDNSDPDPAVSGGVSAPPEGSPTPDVSNDPSDGGATGLSLSRSEFSISDDYPDPVTLTVTFSPAGTTAAVTWSSSDPDVASVDENGKVSAGSKRGSATITATLPNGASQTCKVYNQRTGASSSSSGDTSGNTSPAPTTYTINNPDFTFYRTGETYQLKVNGYTGSVSWSSSNTGIATVSSDGTVTAAGSGRGSCTVTGTLDNGTTVEAIVRINIS